MFSHRLIFLILISIGFPTFAKDAIPKWISEGPVITAKADAFDIPVEVLATKMYVQVMLGGKVRRFVVDTGSPSMLDKTIAKELGLKVVAQNKGRDAHGRIIESDIVQAELAIGSVTFRNVPMMTADFSASPATRLFVGDGLIGSELLTTGVWQFDLKQQRLRFNRKIQDLPNIQGATKVKLYQFGYPYMPIFDIRLAEHATSKALFDTGSPSLFTLSRADYQGILKSRTTRHGAEKNTKPLKVLHGFGSPGYSLGGQAVERPLLMVKLDHLSVAGLPIKPLYVSLREPSPSLIGARVLEKYIITLDAQKQSAWLYLYNQAELDDKTFGFDIAFDHQITVGAVWNGSPADKAGLTVGMPVQKINGHRMSFDEESLRHYSQAMKNDVVVINSDDKEIKLRKEPRDL